jgi:hypothetical protein
MSIAQSGPCHPRLGPVLVRWRMAILATLLLGPIISAMAQQIPALVVLPASINVSHPSLADRRTALLRERDALHARVSTLNARCAAVEEGSVAAASCEAEQSSLRAALNAHIKQSNDFNAEAHAASNHEVDRAPCSQVAQLQSRFDSLTQQISQDRQVIQNFGFDKTVEQIEYWGSLPGRQVEDAKKSFRAMLFDATLGSVSEAAGAVGSLTPEEVDVLNRLAEAQGAQPLGIVAGAQGLHTSLEFLEKTKHVYQGADDVRKGQMLDAAITLGGLASKNRAFGLLLTADGWAAYQVYQSAKAVKTVNYLTRLIEGDLILLKSRSEKLKNSVNQLTAVKKQLAELGAECDSTNLVQKP